MPLMTHPRRQTANARIVLERRYLAKDDNGNLAETPEQLFRRVADNLAGDGHGQPDKTRFRRRVIGLPSLTHLTED